MAVEQKCKEIFGMANEARGKQYEALIKQLCKSKDGEGMIKLVTHLVRTEGTTQHGRTYVTPEALKVLIADLGNEEAEVLELAQLEKVAKTSVDILREKAEDFPYALMKAIDLLSKVYQAQDEMKKAAFILSSFKFDYRQLNVSAAEKVAWYVNTAEFWLEVEETGSASQQIKKAHVLLNEIKGDAKLIFKFKTAHARVSDAERRFLDAAQKYLELAQIGTGIVSEPDLLRTLENAVTCAILAQPGPSRSRVLAMLINDERSQQCRNVNLLEKMFKERIVRSSEVQVFEKMLATHQNADTSTGRTVLQNSIIEHNLFAASKIYNNISFAELGVLLGIGAKEAEELSSTMIDQGRMKATIDQVDGLVEFETATDSLRVWDQQIQSVCLLVNDVLENITKKHPQYKDY